MNQISSSNPLNVVFSLVCLGFLVFIAFFIIFSGVFESAPFVLLIPVLMFVFSFLFFKHLIWSAVDDVFDCNDYLLVRKSDNEYIIYLKDILSVEGRHSAPERVIVNFRSSTGGIEKIMFHPKTRVSIFSVHPIVLDLNKRIRNAKSI